MAYCMIYVGDERHWESGVGTIWYQQTAISTVHTGQSSVEITTNSVDSMQFNVANFSISPLIYNALSYLFW